MDKPKIKRFEDILAWQKAKDLSLSVYIALKNSRDWGFNDQVQRASVSVMNNIAEGYERRTQKEFRFFLFVAKASCGEVRSMLYLAKELEKISVKEFERRHGLAEEISKMIAGLIKSLGEGS